MAIATRAALAVTCAAVPREGEIKLAWEFEMMRKTIRGAIPALALALALTGCGSPADQPAGEAPSDASASSDTAAPAESAAATAAATPAAGARPAAFAQCMSCHAVEPGKHGVGPSLAGVYGTKAGEIPGYAFSAPLKASGLTWDDATLDQWLAGPAKLVPGTKMVYAGQPDAAKRKELIDYIKSLK